MEAGPKLLTLVRRAIRLRHYSRHTEEAYVAWVRRFVRPGGIVRVKEPGRVPVVLTREALSLRVKDIDFGRGEIMVRRGKGGRDRATMLPDPGPSAAGGAFDAGREPPSHCSDPRRRPCGPPRGTGAQTAGP